MTFQERLEQLINDAEKTIKIIIRTDGTESRFYNELSLRVSRYDLNFSLDNGRYLYEITENGLVDNYGYTYSYGVLSAEQFVELVDYFRKH